MAGFSRGYVPVVAASSGYSGHGYKQKVRLSFGSCPKHCSLSYRAATSERYVPFFGSELLIRGMVCRYCNAVLVSAVVISKIGAVWRTGFSASPPVFTVTDAVYSISGFTGRTSGVGLEDAIARAAATATTTGSEGIYAGSTRGCNGCGRIWEHCRLLSIKI